MKITISVDNDFSKLLNQLAEKTQLKKSTIIKMALIEWSKKNDKI